MIHIEYEGRSYEVAEDQLDVSESRTDAQLKAQLAFFLDVWPRLLDGYHVDRLPDGTLLLHT
jgi:hypothetical protein